MTDTPELFEKKEEEEATVATATTSIIDSVVTVIATTITAAVRESTIVQHLVRDSSIEYKYYDFRQKKNRGIFP